MFSGLDTPKTASDITLSAEKILPPSNPFGDVAMSMSEMSKAAALADLIADLDKKFMEAKQARRGQEKIWLDSYKAFRGEHSASELERISKAKSRNRNSSEVFVKITKTKTVAALGQIHEILFGTDKFPIGIEATPEPKGIAKDAFIVPEQVQIPEDIYGYAGDGRTIEPGSTSQSLLSGLYSKYKNLLTGKKVQEGPSPDPKQFPQISPAAEAAANMERIILDQMEEGDLRREIKRAEWEIAVLGSGCIKGPLTYSNTTHTWKQEDSEDGESAIVYAPEVTDIPKSFWVSIWNLYPDPNAYAAHELGYMFEKHLLTRQQVTDLKKFAGFDTGAIDRILRREPTRDREYWEAQIREVDTTFSDNRYEFLEYWGYLKAEHIANFKPELKKKLESLVDQAHVNVWKYQNEVVRLVINPFVPERIPYYIVPYEEAEYQLWGISIPENMKDPQMLMNGHYRMMIDNLAYAGNCIFEVNDATLVQGQDNDMYPGKVFHKVAGTNQPSLQAIQIPNVAQSHLQAFDKARQLADEVSGQPSYSYGQTGVQATNRTAAGMSMLMGAASGSIKQVVKNYDDYLLKPLGEAYFNWNMQFNKKASIRGDVKIVAKGTSALMQKEVQSQRLLQFLQIVSGNQLLTPFANLDYILKEIAKALDLDPDKTVNDPDMAKLMADIMGAVNGQPPASGAPQLPQDGSQPPPAEGNMNVTDTSGGGGSQIGVGTAPQPGAAGFTG